MAYLGTFKCMSLTTPKKIKEKRSLKILLFNVYTC